MELCTRISPRDYLTLSHKASTFLQLKCPKLKYLTDISIKKKSREQAHTISFTSESPSLIEYFSPSNERQTLLRRESHYYNKRTFV